MNCVERVKMICKERKIPISKLERDLGYANGYIGQLRKGTFPANRLSEIAEYLSLSSEFLMTGTEEKKTPIVGDPLDDSTLMFALWGDAPMDEEDLEDVKRYAAYLKAKKEASP